jgi:hypothetical protein
MRFNGNPSAALRFPNAYIHFPVFSFSARHCFRRPAIIFS